MFFRSTLIAHKTARKPYFIGLVVLKEIITKNIKRTSKPLEIQYFQGFSLYLHFRKKIYKYRKPLIPVLAGQNGL